MNLKQAKQRIDKLRKLINHHRYLYHVLDRQEISEAALDSLKKELADLEEQFPDLITRDSPTQRVGGRALARFAKIRRKMPMLSFRDAFSEADVKNWLERNQKLLTGEERKRIDFYCEPKLDGLAIELVYQDSILKTGSTRGDGFIGEDVTQNLKTIDSIPLRLRPTEEVVKDLDKEGLSEIAENIREKGLKELIVRGEAIIAKKEFLKINKEQEKRRLAPYANPRNLAAGSIRQLDPAMTAARRLDVNIYSLISNLGQKTHEQEHKILKALGFKSNNIYNKFCQDIKEVFAFWEFRLKDRQNLPYEIDGIVVLINDNQISEKLGVVGKAPRGSLAFKFPLKEAVTRVEDIRIQVGRTGALTPVAVLTPVLVGGVTVSHATLHNEDEIQRLGLRIGDTVVVGRAGDVIPDIVRVLPELRTGRERKFVRPKKCPACGTLLAKAAGEVVLRCPNSRCFARLRKSFYHFVSRVAFDIAGLGPKIIDRLCDLALIQDPADLFLLKESDLFALERFGEKSAQNLISAIESKKKITFSRFLFALGIRNVGEETAQALAGRFERLENLKKTDLEDLQKVEDVGPIVARSIFKYFGDQTNLRFLTKLKKAGVIIQDTKYQIQDTKFRNLIFVFTGELKNMTRQKARERIRGLGGDVSAFLSSKTNYLVVGQNPGSKLARARKLGVEILTESKFLEMIS